jgi:hypothetical protein
MPFSSKPSFEAVCLGVIICYQKEAEGIKVATGKLCLSLVEVYLPALLDNANKILLKTVSFALHQGFGFLKSPLPAFCYRVFQLYLFVKPILGEDDKTKRGQGQLLVDITYQL